MRHCFLFQRVVIQRVLPHLCSEFSNQAMIPFVLPNVLLVAEGCTEEEYNDLIFPKLKPVLKIQDPVQVTLSKGYVHDVIFPYNCHSGVWNCLYTL